MSLATWAGDDGTTIALDGSDGVQVMRGVRGLDGPPIRNTMDPRIGDGSILVAGRRPERAITLPLMIDTDTIGVGEVVGAFQAGTLTAESGRHLDTVVYEDGFEGQWSVTTGGVNGQAFRKFTLSLVALDPWWYGPAASTSGTFGTATAWNAAIAWNASTPWNGGSSSTVTNTGDVAAPCTVVVKGAATTATFSLNGMGGWETAGAVASGAYLSVSGVPGERGPHRGSHGYFADTSTAVDWSLLSAGSQLFDLPAGASSLVFGVTGSDGSTAWSMYWSPRYFVS